VFGLCVRRADDEAPEEAIPLSDPKANDPVTVESIAVPAVMAPKAAAPKSPPKPGRRGAEAVNGSPRKGRGGIVRSFARGAVGVVNAVAVAGMCLIALTYNAPPAPRSAAAPTTTRQADATPVEPRTTATRPDRVPSPGLGPWPAPEPTQLPPSQPPAGTLTEGGNRPRDVIAQVPRDVAPAAKPTPVPPVTGVPPTAAVPTGETQTAIATPPAIGDTSAATSQPAPQTLPVTAPIAAAHRLNLKEADYVAKLDGLLAPTRSLTTSIEDATRVRDAFAAASNLPTARALRDSISDPVARKLVEWSILRNGGGSIREVRNFLAENPDWPNRDLMVQRAEEYVFTTGGTARDVKAHFAGSEPKTAVGRAALASALLAEQDETGAAKLAARAWREGDIPTTLETGFIERFGKLLKPEDHKWRLDRLLLDDSRWENERRDRASVIRRVLPFLSDAERAKATARLAVYMRAPEANKLLAALPEDAATNPVADWGFAFQLAQWHRRAGRPAEAWEILRNAPTEATLGVNLDDWWEERRLGAYEALKAAKPDVAYELVKAPGSLGVNARKDAAFMAGWLALQHLGQPKLAEPHFKDLELAADGPLSRAKAGWWLSKTYTALADPQNSKAGLERAARNVDTFYGLMAQQLLTPGLTRLTVTTPQLPTQAEATAFNRNDAVKAIVIARRSGLDQSVTRAFLGALRNTQPNEPEQAMLAHLAEAIGDTQMAVRLSKSAVARGLNLITYAYPIHPMPAYQPLRPPPEPAMLLAVARQESEFLLSTKSGAGARGLLQVMPITANHVCKDYRLKCEVDRLGVDPAYNVMMGSAYIADRMDEFTGSYVLTLAGYNAGPGRTRQWIREFGDPRDPSVDPIDWIHRIPFEETRDYVVKVLSNIQIYRARLGDEANALQLTRDLRRFAPSSKRAANSVPTVNEPTLAR
jgi:soluble lytic murein transglycosylase